jgi:carbamoyl-phosphate synthase large subunit
MRSVGEAMAIGGTFKEALQKALRSLEIGRAGLGADGKDPFDEVPAGAEEKDAALDAAITRLRSPRPDRLFRVRDAMRLGVTLDELNGITGIDPWFLDQVLQLVETEDELRSHRGGECPPDLLRRAKSEGFSDVQLGWLLGRSEGDVRARRYEAGLRPVMKTVDTCAAEFAAHTPYHYSTYGDESEVVPSDREKILILGGGPNRIGQGIEFDYCCVHAVQALSEAGYETILLNSNPETVSTDYDTADRLYFEPLTLEDILEVVEAERPKGVVVQFGGQTPLKLALGLEAAGVPILGTSPDAIDRAEDRERFLEVATRLGISLPPGGTAVDLEGALVLADRIGFPVLVRPSYVLGGRAMRIVYDREQLTGYLDEAIEASPEHPVQIDRFLEDAFEFDVDAIADGDRCVIGGIMQHIEEAGIHSGDSACVLPPYRIRPGDLEIMRRQVAGMARELGVRGLINAQFAVQNGEVYLLEVNPRASRTVPFVSKAIGRPLAKVAARVMAGETLEELGLTEEPRPAHVSVKEAVLPFDKFPQTDPFLGPEMKSTGEVMGIAASFGLAFAKSQMAANEAVPLAGTAFLSVNDRDHAGVVPIARELARLKFDLCATRGTAKALERAGLRCRTVPKISEGRPHAVDLIANGDIDLIIATPLGKVSRADESEIRRAAIRKRLPVLSTLSAAAAAVRAVRALSDRSLEVRSLQEYHDPSEPEEADLFRPVEPVETPRR